MNLGMFNILHYNIYQFNEKKLISTCRIHIRRLDRSGDLVILLDDMANNINGWSVAAQQRVKDNLSELSVYDYRLLSTSLMLLSVEVGLGQGRGWPPLDGVFVAVDCPSKFGSQCLDELDSSWFVPRVPSWHWTILNWIQRFPSIWFKLPIEFLRSVSLSRYQNSLRDVGVVGEVRLVVEEYDILIRKWSESVGRLESRVSGLFSFCPLCAGGWAWWFFLELRFGTRKGMFSAVAFFGNVWCFFRVFLSIWLGIV